MTLARFFHRSFAAVGRHIAIDRDELEERLTGTMVGVACSDSSSAGNDQIIAELVVNLLARLYPRIAIDAPLGIVEQLSVRARAINPTIEIIANDACAWIAIDRSIPNARNIHPRASGWVAELELSPITERGTENAYAAAAAGCLAVSELFRSIFVSGWTQKAYRVSLLDFSTNNGDGEQLEAAKLEVALVGLGAVGNAAVWTIARDRSATGTLTIVEPETVELSNLQRYLLTTDADVGHPKIDLAIRELASTSFKVERFDGALEVWNGSGTNLLVTVDNVATRRHAQALLPRLVVNGWTSDAGLGASWHRFDGDTACLACLYHPQGPSPSQTELAAQALRMEPARAALLWINKSGIHADEMKQIAAALGIEYKRLRPWVGKPIQALYSEVICGYVGIDVKGTGQLEAVPLSHQSVLAGILAAAELRKRLDSKLEARSQPEGLIAYFDVVRDPPTYWSQTRARVAGCICSDPIYRQVFATKWSTA